MRIRSLLASTLIVATLTGTLSPATLAATEDQRTAIQTASRLRSWLNASETLAVAMALSLPADARFSPQLAEQMVPGWQRLRERLKKLQVSELDRQGPAHRAVRRLEAFARQVKPTLGTTPAIGSFSAERYRAQVAMFAGLESLPWPGLPDRMARFTNRLMGHPDNQLADVCGYLKAYYKELGLTVEEQAFDWQGKSYSNVIVTIPGTSDETVLLVDHIDVAAVWDYPTESLKELSAYDLGSDAVAAIRQTHKADAPAPGADDNASATAALMEAGRLFAGKRPPRTIKLVHMNGEEFPGDCAGARHYVAQAMQRQERIAAVVVMDMIGVNRQRDGVFQISVGRHPQSLALADMALSASRTYAKGLKPVVRGCESPLSYLYNTDGLVFSLAGYPVILLNEHLNHDEDLNRLGYHDEFDRPELINWDYARSIASVGLATALQAASSKGGPAVDPRRQEALRHPAARVTDFQIELANSPLYEAMVAAETKLGRPVSDPELQAMLDDDRQLDGDEAAGSESVVNRVTTWFAESGMAPITDDVLIAELRLLRLRQLAMAGGSQP